jgi:uncharacterized NAD(P)/FAD-binding protein YdhS
MDPTDFAPRLVYARYLEHTLRAAQADACPGVELDSRRAAVVDVDTHCQTLFLGGGEALAADRTVLALGNFPPRPLLVANDHGLVREDPWAPGGLENLNPDDSVLLVGTGLTMVDVVVSLVGARQHRGSIYAVSRRGQLPHVHAELGPKPVPPATELRTTTLALLRQLRSAARASEDWRAVIDGLRPVTQSTWQSASAGERARFLRHVQPYWDTHRHRIAPQIGRLIAETRASGQLRVLAGRLLGVEDGRARIAPRGQAEQTLEVARIVNCTGPATSFESLDEPLLGRLRTQRLAVVDELNLGFRTTEDGRLFDADGQPSARIFSIGPMRRGELWETTAVPDIRVQAAHLAQTLVAELELD